MTLQQAEAKIISHKKRGTLMEPLKVTEPHCMFCGNPVEEHYSTSQPKLINHNLMRKNRMWLM